MVVTEGSLKSCRKHYRQTHHLRTAVIWLTSDCILMSDLPVQGWRAWHPNPPVPCTGRLRPPCVSSRTPPVPTRSKIPSKLSHTQQDSYKYLMDMELCVFFSQHRPHISLSLPFYFYIWLVCLIKKVNYHESFCVYTFSARIARLSLKAKKPDTGPVWWYLTVIYKWCKYLCNNRLIFLNISLMIVKFVAGFCNLVDDWKWLVETYILAGLPSQPQ